MKLLTFIITIFCSLISFAQSSGDILFIGFNADGDKDFSIITMVDIPPNTTIYFTDNEPNLAGDGNMGSEGVLKWNTGTSVIKKGSVIVFSDVDSALNPSFGCSVGVLSVVDAGFNISSSGDVLYASYGNPAEGNVAKWICGIQNSNTSLEANFSATGLSITSDYVVINNTASKDGGEYSGTRTGKTIEDYKALILNEENWVTSTTDGEKFVPFSQTPFSFLTLSLVNHKYDDISVNVVNHKIVTNKGSVLAVFNMLGQKQENSQLSQGLYIVGVIYKSNRYYIKILI